MSDALLRARRVVAFGAAALVVVLLALAAAAWRLLDAETQSAGVRGRSAAMMAADDLVRTLVERFGSEREPVVLEIEGNEVRNPIPPRPFVAAPPFEDREAAFIVRESGAWGGDLARAALRTALKSSDRAVRVAAAAEGVRRELREATGRESAWEVPDDGTRRLPLTRDEVLVGLARGDDFAWASACDVVGSEDDASAASMLISLWWMGADSVRQRRTALAEGAALLAAFRRTVEVEGRWRAAVLESGEAVVGVRFDERWCVHRVSAPDVRAAATEILAPRAMRLVHADSATLPIAVPAPGGAGWSIASSFSEVEARSRGTLLIAGLAVAATAAVLAFAAFARSVRREARMATLRTEFVATVSHELRTPVAIVRTSAETLAAGRATTDADRHALTVAIVRESERLSDLVGNVLDFSRMESGRRTYDLREIDVGALVGDVASRHAGVVVEIEDGLPPLRCDREALAGAVANLLDNARKFGPPGAPIALRARREGNDVVLEVEDHGIGVPDAEKRQVFERFFRGADPRVRETRGAGIGLALVQHAAEAHGGRVEVADTRGGGATFRIVLPLAHNGAA